MRWDLITFLRIERGSNKDPTVPKLFSNCIKMATSHFVRLTKALNYARAGNACHASGWDSWFMRVDCVCTSSASTIYWLYASPHLALSLLCSGSSQTLVRLCTNSALTEHWFCTGSALALLWIYTGRAPTLLFSLVNMTTLLFVLLAKANASVLIGLIGSVEARRGSFFMNCLCTGSALDVHWLYFHFS